MKPTRVVLAVASCKGLLSLFLLLCSHSYSVATAAVNLQSRQRVAHRPYPTLGCAPAKRFGRAPPSKCRGPVDPNLKPRTALEQWFTRRMWDDFFPRANHGWGSSRCMPYSYEAFLLASRYFPDFGTGGGIPPHILKDSPYNVQDLERRDVAAFFAHVVQETGENNLRVFNSTKLSKRDATECFYRGGLYHYYEGGAESRLFSKHRHAFSLSDGESCTQAGRYCKRSPELDLWYPCRNEQNSSADAPPSARHLGCYFGRGPLQLSWNYNYGQFQQFLHTQGIDVDLLAEPNRMMTELRPPLAMLSALWFYMTPQPPKPSMHDIIMGKWHPSEAMRQQGYNGSVFGPTSAVINAECGGEEGTEDGLETSRVHHGGAENRRIRAFKWFCEKLGVDAGDEPTLSCQGMPRDPDSGVVDFAAIPHRALSWQPDWPNLWKPEPCDCAPATYPGALPYYDPDIYDGKQWAEENERNHLRCVYGLYACPEAYRVDAENNACLNHTARSKPDRWGTTGQGQLSGKISA